MLFTTESKGAGAKKVTTVKPIKEYDPDDPLLSGISESEFNGVINVLKVMEDTDFVTVMVGARPSYKKIIKYLAGEGATDYISYLDYVDSKIEQQKIQERQTKMSKKKQQNLINDILNIFD